MAGVLAKVFGMGGAGKIIDALGRAVDDLHTSKEEKLQLEQALEALRQEPGKLQVELNKVEAQHRSIFVAGWRPALGWCLTAGVAYHYVFRGLVVWALRLLAPDMEPPPDLDPAVLVQLIVAMLGLAGMRSWDKKQGTAG